MKKNLPIWKKQPHNIIEKANVFQNLQSQSRLHRESKIVHTMKIKAKTSLKLKKLWGELRLKNLLLTMQKNLQSDTNNKIRNFLENNQKIVKSLA